MGPEFPAKPGSNPRFLFELGRRKAAQTSGGIVVAGAIYKGVGLVSILISCLPICFLASL